MERIGIVKNGLLTGLFLQLAIGPVFFFIVNLTLQKTILDGFVAVLAVTIVDYLYIILAILGINKLLEKKKLKKIFKIISSTILIIFGIMIVREVIINGLYSNIEINSPNLLASFVFVFFITISSPLTIIFFTGIFTAKAIEYNYTKKQLWYFGFAVGLSTFLFMSTTIIITFFLKNLIPFTVIKVLNLVVGLVLIGYGIFRILNSK